MAKNLFLQICEALNVPHTQSFTNSTFNEHPYKYTLFGLSRMLEGYGIETCGVRIEDKDASLSKLETPFVAQVSGDLVLVKAITVDEVIYQSYDATAHISYDKFTASWSGVALLIIPGNDAGEPDRKEHRHAELVQSMKKWGTVGCAAIILGIVSVQQIPHISLFMLSQFILNISGLYICFLLLLRQLNLSSRVADKLCNLLKHATCTDILDTSAAYAAYGISWSETGSAYFTVNAFVILLCPASLPHLSFFSLAALGYVAWSIWYQRFHAHAWCTLCLIVQAILTVQALIYIFHLSITNTRCLLTFWRVDGGEVLLFSFIALSYLATTLIIHHLLAVISKANKADRWKSSLHNLKLRTEVFDALLQCERHFAPIAKSIIRFGNPNAPYRLTILTNPYCNPCSTMHARMSGLKLTNCCIELVFSSFGKEHDRVCRLMIAAYLQLGLERAWLLYGEWYESGKVKQESFFDNLGLNDESHEVQTEYEQHIAWRKQTELTSTPALLVNGYSMPAIYTIEDFIILLKEES